MNSSCHRPCPVATLASSSCPLLHDSKPLAGHQSYHVIPNSQSVSPSQAHVWTASEGAAQSAAVRTNRTAALSISFLALMVGVPSISWQEAPTQLVPRCKQDVEFLLLLGRVGYPRQDIFGTVPPPPPSGFCPLCEELSPTSHLGSGSMIHATRSVL